MRRWMLMMTAAAALAVAFSGCSKKSASEDVALTKEGPGGGAAGVTWSFPSRWTKQPARTMRVATYAAPAASGDAEGGECAVFFFGTSQGGDVESNIQRWSGQFEGAPQSSRSQMKVNGFNVTRVVINGSYLAPSGPMMMSAGKKDNFRLLGGIVEAPEGMLFFKMTGPAKTMEEAEKEFEALLNSLEKK